MQKKRKKWDVDLKKIGKVECPVAKSDRIPPDEEKEIAVHSIQRGKSNQTKRK